MISWRAAATVAALSLAGLACSAESTSPDDVPAVSAETTSPQGRAVSIETTACGHASSTTGAGVVVANGWVLAAAHVVSGAGQVDVSGDFGTERAEIVVFDRAGDLALLQVGRASATPVDLGVVTTGDRVHFASVGVSGNTSAVVLRPVEVRIEGVRSLERISRFGYELDERVALGESGGGVFDDDERLVGIIFGRPVADDARSFVVNSDEIARVLEAERDGAWICDPSVHQVVPSESR